MKIIIKWFEKLPLIKKILMVYAGLVILPLFILVIYLSKTEFERLYSQTVNSKQLAIEQLTQNIRTFMLSADDLSRNLAYRSPISSLISRSHLDKFPVWTKRSSEEILEAVKDTLKWQNMGIEEISIYSNKTELLDQKIFFDESLLYEFEFYSNFKFQQKDSDFYLLNEEATNLYFKKKGVLSHNKEVLLLVRNIQNEEEELYSGLLVFEINPEKIRAAFSLNENNYGDYTVYFQNIQSFWGEQLSADVILDMQVSSANYKENHTEVVSGHLYSNIKDYNIFIVDENIIDKGNYMVLIIRICGIFILLIIIQALGLRMLIRHILKIVNRNINEMDNIVANGFEGQIMIDEQDEFRDISMRYNLLLKKIQTLIADMLKKERDTKEAQIKALQYQMNPHFIYNTLSIFASNAEENRNFKLSEAISYFGHLLRYNIKNNGMFATFKEELDNAYSLIKVYSIRCRETIELHIEVAEEFYKIKITKFLLQPILENAILHGIKAKKEQIQIKISVQVKDEILEILIEDNGEGIEEEYLKKIKNNIVIGEELDNPSPKSSFLGLRNIYKRLQLIYGEESELLIDSVYGTGTIVTIKIPIKSINESWNKNEIFDSSR